MSAEERQHPDGSRPGKGAPGREPSTAAIVTRKGEQSSLYPMFAASAITPQGAFLRGALFLELNEVVNIELSLGAGVTVQVRAQVRELERGEVPGMMVAFSNLDEGARALLDTHAQGASEP